MAYARAESGIGHEAEKRRDAVTIQLFHKEN
jgi:hypothetical protein